MLYIALRFSMFHGAHRPSRYFSARYHWPNISAAPTFAENAAKGNTLIDQIRDKTRVCLCVRLYEEMDN